MATSARHTMYYIAESAYGTTPATPSMSRLRHTGTTLGVTKSTHLSEELRPDRQISDFRHGAKQVGGDINAEMSYGSFDDLLEAVLCGTWASDVLKAGVTRRSFSVMRHFSDIADGAGKPYHVATGVEFNTFRLSIPTDGIVTTTFGVVGKDIVPATAAPTGATLGNPTTTKVMDSFSGTVKENDTLIATVTEIQLTLENGITPRFAIGSDEVTGQASIGRSNLTGQITAYFEDAALLEKFLNPATESSLEFTLVDDAGNSYEILIPRIKYTGGQPDTDGQGDITITMPFQAVYDEGEASNIVITRTDAV